MDNIGNEAVNEAEIIYKMYTRLGSLVDSEFVGLSNFKTGDVHIKIEDQTVTITYEDGTTSSYTGPN